MKNTSTPSNINRQRQSQRSSSSASSRGRFFGPPPVPAPAPVPSSLDLPLRYENQWLRAGDVLGRLRRQLPDQARFAKCVGLSVWLSFPEAPSAAVRTQLSQLGFTWVSARQSWQHPCGQFESAAAE